MTARMKTSAAFVTVLLLMTLAPGTLRAGKDACLACHSGMGDKPSQAFAGDVHGKAGLSCASCHGGNASAMDDMEAAMNKKRGFKGVPKGGDISTTCGGCHNDSTRMRGYGYKGPTGQLSALRASAHSQSLGTSTELIMQCTTCHGAHGITHVKDPASPVSPLKVVALCSNCHSNPAFMRRYNPGLPTDQLAKYRTSMHGELNAKGDAKPATCASCHTAHAIKPAKETASSVHPLNIPATCSHCHSNAAYMAAYKIPTDQYEKFRGSVHGKLLLEKKDASAPACNSCHGNHGAAPPNVESISNVCGTCHALNAELFRTSRHATEFEKSGLPGCETCHGNHGVQPATPAMLALGSGTLCGSCHSDTKAPEGFRTAKRMRAMLDSLTGAIAASEKLLNEAEQKGMEIDDIRFSLRDAKQAGLQSRTAVHSFTLEGFEKVVGPGMKIAQTALSDAKEANHEYYFRRSGLAVATLIITITVVLLWLYIRGLEKRTSPARGGSDTHVS